MARDWTDMIVGARMQVDSEFAPEVDSSQFTRQEWGLIMTAVEFRVEHPHDPERARLTADTSALPDVMPEVERVGKMQGQGMAGPREESSGVLGSVKDALGLGGGGGDTGGSDADKVRAAESLVQAYSTQLQDHLEESGRWHEVREAAGESGSGSS